MSGLSEETAAVEDAAAVPPVRRGGRQQRREETLRALAAGEEACCAYCGQVLPPLPPRGGRPTPYCPADAERYGQWGAKTITCAMLDEHREIWVQVYGPEQPMTQLDVHTLDERLSTALGVLDPVRAEIAALQTHASSELAAALAARTASESARDQALEQARAAEADRDTAQAEAALAREQAEEARTARAEAEAAAVEAGKTRDQAISERDGARRDAGTALADRQAALDQVTAAHERIAELQNSLTCERAAALERLDQVRRDEDQARRQLRESLTTEWQQHLEAREAEFTERLRSAQSAADQRIGDLTAELTASTRNYADTLAPLHEQIAELRGKLAEQTAATAATRHRLDEIRSVLTDSLGQTTDDALRRHLDALLARITPEPQPDGDARPN